MIELDSQIIKAAAHKDSAAFKKLYDFYCGFVWRVIFRMVAGDAHLSSHVVQEVFVKVYGALKKYRFDAAFSTWLYRIAYTTALNEIRQKKNREQKNVSIDYVSTAITTQSRFEDTDLAERILQKLNPDERFLIVAREIDGISFKELEIITGKDSGTLRVQLSRIKEAIRKEYGNERY